MTDGKGFGLSGWLNYGVYHASTTYLYLRLGTGWGFRFGLATAFGVESVGMGILSITAAQHARVEVVHMGRRSYIKKLRRALLQSWGLARPESPFHPAVN